MLIYIIQNDKYIFSVFYVLFLTLLFTGTIVTLATIIFVLLILAIKMLVQEHKKIDNNKIIPICSYIGIFNIVFMILSNFVNSGMW